jgi:hypothetical protein
MDETGDLRSLGVCIFLELSSSLNDRGVKIEIKILQMDLPRFDFRKIEKVVDNGQQGRA